MNSDSKLLSFGRDNDLYAVFSPSEDATSVFSIDIGKIKILLRVEGNLKFFVKHDDRYILND